MILTVSPVLVLGTFFWGFVITLLIRHRILEMITRAGFVRPNFKDDLIPVGSGVIFPLSLIAGLIPLLPLWPGNQMLNVFIYIFALTFASFLGLIDDFWGSRETSGLKGHLGSLLKGQMTTGGLKALWGGVLALGVAVAAGPLYAVPVNAPLLALSINAINLLDLRPGRAGKVFVLGAIVFIFFRYQQPEILPLTLTLGCVCAFLPLDLKARTMMGDAGSNALGAALGIAAVWFLEFEAKCVLLLLLVLFHLLTEKYSLTKLIARNRVLNFFDSLGREE